MERRIGNGSTEQNIKVSEDVNIVYNLQEDDPNPTMVGCVKLGRKPKKGITQDILPAECATMHDQFAVTPEYSSSVGKRIGRPACYPYEGPYDENNHSCGSHGSETHAAVYASNDSAVKKPQEISRKGKRKSNPKRESNKKRKTI